MSGKTFSSSLTTKPVLALEQQPSSGFEPTYNTQTSDSILDEASGADIPRGTIQITDSKIKISANLQNNGEPKPKRDRRVKHPKFKVQWTDEEVR